MKTLAMAALTALTLLAAAPAPSPPAVTVHIKDFAFVPARLTVDAGTSVRFVNDDGEAHTVTAADKSFDSEGLDTGAQWTHRFANPSTYAYFCELHPYMKGTIVVRPSSQS
jgi:plastocyanin